MSAVEVREAEDGERRGRERGGFGDEPDEGERIDHDEVERYVNELPNGTI